MNGRFYKSSNSTSQPHFMQSTRASRAQEIKPAIVTPSPSARGKSLLNRATQRIFSLGSGKRRGSVLSPRSARRESSLILKSPTRRTSHLPEPVKKEEFSQTTSDKPLPSLPVATFERSSPVQRRSLIDATDRPLRQSVSPGVFVDWPALSPVRNYEKRDRKKHKMPNQQSPSLGESVIERMRKLNIEDDKKSLLPRVSSRSKAHAQTYTPHTDSIAHVDNNEASDQNDQYLKPRKAPDAPTDTPTRTKSNAKIDHRSSLKGLNVIKTRKPVATNRALTLPQEPDNGDGGSLRERPTHGTKAATTPSSIPRPTRDSFGSNFSPTSPKMIKLKRAQGQITDLLKKSSDCKPEQEEDIDHTNSSTQDPPISPTKPIPEQPRSRRTSGRHSDTKVLSTWAMRDAESQERQDGSNSDSSASTIHHELHASPISTPTRSMSSKENIPPEFNELENLSPMKTYKFPPVNNDEDGQSILTRATSVSSLSKAGTVYAHDENGLYRLKPVSDSNPKHGPYIRIDHSADKLFLTDEGLANVLAKREAYEDRKRRSARMSQEVPELASLRLVNEETVSAIKLSHTDSSIPTTWLHQAHSSLSQQRDRLAPSVSSDIPQLTHSPTGWPLLVSKIAPFAELGPPSPKSSASESETKTPNTPQQNRLSVVDEAPPSAYTIRTALARLDQERDVSPKNRKSLPNLPAARTKPIVSESAGPKVETGLRKQTSDILRSYVGQRANPKPITPSNQFMRSYNSPSQHALQNSSPDLPSSPPIMAGHVNSGKAKMMNHVKGLFHKTSREASLSLRTSKSSALGSVRRSTPTMSSPTTSDLQTKKKTSLARLSSVRNKVQTQTRGETTSGSRTADALKPEQPFMTSALEPAEIRDATALAFKLLDKARASDLRRNGLHGVEEIRAAEKKREEYVELARGLVAIVTLARDAEKAMEEAKAAAAKAEIEVIRCRENVGDVCGIVEKMLK